MYFRLGKCSFRLSIWSVVHEPARDVARVRVYERLALIRDYVLSISSDFSNHACPRALGDLRQVECFVVMLKNDRCDLRMRNPHVSFLRLGAEDDGRMEMIHASMDEVEIHFRAKAGAVRKFDTRAGNAASAEVFEADEMKQVSLFQKIEQAVGC